MSMTKEVIIVCLIIIGIATLLFVFDNPPLWFLVFCAFTVVFILSFSYFSKRYIDEYEKSDKV